ncbi:MAG: HAD-IC family P-type ATPase, partial [Candidatus Jordarchaeaceae archaeon]
MKRVNDERFSVNFEIGLSSREVRRRIEEYGYNEIPEVRVSPIVDFVKKFWGPIPWMLEITIVLTFILGKYFEMIIVFSLLASNAVIGFAQERKANFALAFLKQRLRVTAKVKRNGKWVLISARELVPGDVVRLRTGDFVPADIEIVEGIVEVDQSALTGESLSLEKNVGDVLFSGSMIRRGEITGFVTSTGVNTYFGRTVELVQVAKPKSHMEWVILNVVKWLVILVCVLLLVALAFTMFKGMNLYGILPLAVILLVSAVPVALPTKFTISMALGSLEL